MTKREFQALLTECIRKVMREELKSVITEILTVPAPVQHPIYQQPIYQQPVYQQPLVEMYQQPIAPPQPEISAEERRRIFLAQMQGELPDTFKTAAPKAPVRQDKVVSVDDKAVKIPGTVEGLPASLKSNPFAEFMTTAYD